MRENELLIAKWSPIHLRDALKQWFWRDEQPDVPVLEVWRAFCSYPYLPRLFDCEVFLQAIADGVASHDYFGYAAGRENERYLGLLFGQRGPVHCDQKALLIRPEVAQAQIEAEKEAKPTPAPTPGTGKTRPSTYPTGNPGKPGIVATPTGHGNHPSKPSVPPKKRFHGTIQLDPLNVGLTAA